MGVCVLQKCLLWAAGVCVSGAECVGVGVILGLGCVCYQACVCVLHVIPRYSDAASQRGVSEAGRGVQKNPKTGKPNQSRSNCAFSTSSTV